MPKPHRVDASLRVELTRLEERLRGLCLEGLSTVQLRRLVDDDNDRSIFTTALVGQGEDGKKSPVEAWRSVAALTLN